MTTSTMIATETMINNYDGCRSVVYITLWVSLAQRLGIIGWGCLPPHPKVAISDFIIFLYLKVYLQKN